MRNVHFNVFYHKTDQTPVVNAISVVEKQRANKSRVICYVFVNKIFLNNKIQNICKLNTRLNKVYNVVYYAQTL